MWRHVWSLAAARGKNFKQHKAKCGVIFWKKKQVKLRKLLTPTVQEEIVTSRWPDIIKLLRKVLQYSLVCMYLCGYRHNINVCFNTSWVAVIKSFLKAKQRLHSQTPSGWAFLFNISAIMSLYDLVCEKKIHSEPPYILQYHKSHLHMCKEVMRGSLDLQGLSLLLLLLATSSCGHSCLRCHTQDRPKRMEKRMNSTVGLAGSRYVPTFEHAFFIFSFLLMHATTTSLPLQVREWG